MTRNRLRTISTAIVVVLISLGLLAVVYIVLPLWIFLFGRDDAMGMSTAFNSVMAALTTAANIVVAIAACLVVVQIRLAKGQLDAAREQQAATSKWNKINASLAYIPQDGYVPRWRQVCDALGGIGINFETHKAIANEDLSTLCEDNIVRPIVDDYLNALENLATAVSVGAIDDDIAFARTSAAMIAAARFFGPFINWARDAFRLDSWLQLELLAAKWEERLSERKAAHQRELDRVRRAAREAGGLKPKV